MSIHFHPLRIKEIRKETTECISVLFDVPADLQENFRFSQGQSLSMRTTIDGQEVRRTYSICSSPLEKELRVAIKKVEGGIFSTFANEQLKKGDTLDVMQPVGKFYTPLDPVQKKSYLAIAAGSGITPVISLIKATLATEPLSQFTLVYGNRTRHSIIFFEELEALKNKYMERLTLIHILSRERTDASLNFGRLSIEKLEELNKIIGYPQMDEFFVCGPEEMIFSVKGFLEASGIDKKKIHFELFTTPGDPAAKKVTTKTNEENNAGPKSKVTIKLDGRSFDMDLSLDSDRSILDAALQEGADLPFACKGGVCCTCKARLLEGEVHMDVHWGLEEEEIEQGYILTCQSHPRTDKIVIDFDVK